MNGWVEREKQLSVICIKVVIEWKGGDESAERGSVHDEKQGNENGALAGFFYTMSTKNVPSMFKNLQN